MIQGTGARTGLAAALCAALAAPGWAQDAYIQLEAKRSLAEAEEAARRHGGRVEGVAGFEAAGGWYVVAVGPLAQDDAQRRLQGLRERGVVPLDAFLTEGDLYRDRFWPAGAAPQAAPGAPPPEPPAQPDDAADETPRQAFASEAALDRQAREAIQRALEGAGFYEGAIDAAFGRGTRTAMAAWQRARGMEPTGVLTTAQRAALIAEHEAVFDGLGMEVVRDGPAGIAVEMPTAVVRHEGRETPFSRYADPDGRARVVLVSQEGDARALAGLYEVMRTLDVVPRGDGHEIEGDAFRLRGRDAERLVRGFARHADGRIKGMLLVWPAQDEARFDRLWERMRASFETTDEALGPEHATPAPEQRLDRLAGLEVRRPTLERTGFFVDGQGAVLTTAEVAGGSCGSVLIDDAHEARVAWSDGRVALLRPEAPLAPARVAALAEEPGRLGSEVAVAGFPFGGTLGLASLTRGRLEDLRGLEGEEELDRYALAFEPGDAGGPVLAPDGAVAGLLLAGDAVVEGRGLPDRVAFGVDAGRLREILAEAGVPPAPGAGSGDASPERLARQGAEIAVLVTCHA